MCEICYNSSFTSSLTITIEVIVIKGRSRLEICDMNFTTSEYHPFHVDVPSVFYLQAVIEGALS